MPNDASSRGVSAVTAFVLLLALIILGYINSTYNGTIGSIPIVAAAGLLGLAFFIKLAFAVGVQAKAVDWADRPLSIVPLLSIGIFVYQGLQFSSDGPAGFFAIISIAGAVGAVIFGLTDGIASIFGEKYKKAVDAVHEAQVRLSTAADVISKGGGH